LGVPGVENVLVFAVAAVVDAVVVVAVVVVAVVVVAVVALARISCSWLKIPGANSFSFHLYLYLYWQNAKKIGKLF
jgi:hypothetical protein